MKFAHIHETEKGQFLITNIYDAEKENHVVKITFEYEDKVIIAVEISGKSKTETDKVFENLHHRDYLRKTLKGIFNQEIL